MIIIAVLNSKGGVGKTTIATNLAVRACHNFKRVALVDMDANKASLAWAKDRKKYVDAQKVEADAPEVFAGASDPADVVESLRNTGWDVVILDGSPGAFKTTRDAIAIADAIVLPEKSSKDDKQRTAQLAAACVEQTGGKQKTIIVVNDVPMKGKETNYQVEQAEMIIKQVEEYGLPVYRTRNRDAFLMAKNEGLGVHEIDREEVGSSAAKKELDAIYDAVIRATNAKRG